MQLQHLNLVDECSIQKTSPNHPDVNKRWRLDEFSMGGLYPKPRTTSKENNLFGFGAVNNDDDDAPRGDRGGNRGGRGGANAGRRPQKQVMNMGNDEDFPSL